LALASLANIFSYSDTLLLTDTVAIEKLCHGLTSTILELLRNSQNRPQRFYAAAALANASAHPKLASALKQSGGKAVAIRAE